MLSNEAKGNARVSTADGPPIDLSTALRRAGGDMTLLIELVGIFQEDLPERLDRLQRAVHTRHAKDISFVAHALRGSLSGLGAGIAATLAGELEASADQARLDEAAQMFERLSQELARLTAFLADPRWKERPCAS